MRYWTMLTVLLLALSCGCARHYVITLSNGTRFTAVGKPQLKGGFYVYKDIKGQESYVSSARVSEIAPASMAGSDKGFRPSPQR